MSQHINLLYLGYFKEVFSQSAGKRWTIRRISQNPQYCVCIHIYTHPWKYNGNSIFHKQGINRWIKVDKSCKLWNKLNIGF